MPLVEIDTLDALPSQTRDRFRATLLPLPLGGRGLGMGGRRWAVASSRGPDRAESGGVSDPVLDVPRELEPPGAARGAPAFAVLRRRDFRNVYFAVAASELGDALHYIALMWFALQRGGPLGVVAVRLADSVPALVFGLHGGLAADRLSLRRLMIGADVASAATLVPVAVAGSPARCRSAARRRRVRARDRDELLRARVRGDDPGRRRPREPAAGERARTVDGAGALGRAAGRWRPDCSRSSRSRRSSRSTPRPSPSRPR